MIQDSDFDFITRLTLKKRKIARRIGIKPPLADRKLSDVESLYRFTQMQTEKMIEVLEQIAEELNSFY